MAKDLDFVKRPKQKIKPPVATATGGFAKPPLQTGAINQLPSQLLAPRPIRRKTNWPVIITVVVIIILLVFGYLLYKSARVALTPQTAPTTSTVVSGSQATAAKAAANVEVYDSGAGSTVVNQTLALLQQNGITAKNLDKSQLQYDKTYIWYQAGYEEEAQKIAALLTTRDVTLRSTQVNGGFTILIYLGTK